MTPGRQQDVLDLSSCSARIPSGIKRHLNTHTSTQAHKHTHIALLCIALHCFGLWVGVLGGGGFGRGGGWGGQQSRVTVAFGHGSFAFQGVAQGRIACICDPWVRPGMEYRAEAWGGPPPNPLPPRDLPQQMRVGLG